MFMRVLRAADCRPMPWKNGGGTTTEIAVWPTGAGLEDFDWRVSMARVEAAGPFSRFHGVDRTLAILEGEGIVLDVAGRIPVRLNGTSEPHALPADVPTSARLIGGPVTDLNVMTRRGRFSHTVERMRVAAPTDVATGSAATLVFCLDGDLKAEADGAVRFGSRDTLLLDPAVGSLHLEPIRSSIVFAIRIDRPSQAD
jgi:environmental stress-induced protein Ves